MELWCRTGAREAAECVGHSVRYASLFRVWFRTLRSLIWRSRRHSITESAWRCLLSPFGETLAVKREREWGERVGVRLRVCRTSRLLSRGFLRRFLELCCSHTDVELRGSVEVFHFFFCLLSFFLHLFLLPFWLHGICGQDCRDLKLLLHRFV